MLPEDPSERNNKDPPKAISKAERLHLRYLQNLEQTNRISLHKPNRPPLQIQPQHRREISQNLQLDLQRINKNHEKLIGSVILLKTNENQ